MFFQAPTSMLPEVKGTDMPSVAFAPLAAHSLLDLRGTAQ